MSVSISQMITRPIDTAPIAKDGAPAPLVEGSGDDSAQQTMWPDDGYEGLRTGDSGPGDGTDAVELSPEEMTRFLDLADAAGVTIVDGDQGNGNETAPDDQDINAAENDKKKKAMQDRKNGPLRQKVERTLGGDSDAELIRQAEDDDLVEFLVKEALEGMVLGGVLKAAKWGGKIGKWILFGAGASQVSGHGK